MRAVIGARLRPGRRRWSAISRAHADGALLVGLVRDRYPEAGADFRNSSAQQLAAVMRDGRCDYAVKLLLERRSHFRIGLPRYPWHVVEHGMEHSHLTLSRDRGWRCVRRARFGNGGRTFKRPKQLDFR